MEILDWAEGNAEKLVQKYLDAEPNEVFSQNELKNKGDYYIGTESSGDGETVFIDVCFGDEFEKHDNNLEKNYEYFTRYAEDISDNMNYDVTVMTNSDEQTIMFQFTDWFPEESEEPEDYAKGGFVTLYDDYDKSAGYVIEKENKFWTGKQWSDTKAYAESYKNKKLAEEKLKSIKMAKGGKLEKAYEVILQLPNGKMNKRAVLLAKTKEDASKKALNLKEFKQYGYVVISANEIKYASGGKVKEKVFIEYLNKSKGYKMDRKYFNSYQEAERWARNNFDKFSSDYIRYEYAKGGQVLDLKDVYNELRSKVGRLEINEESKDYIYCDIRDWGNWEHDYEDYERDEEDFEDDDSMILSESSGKKMQSIVEEIRTKYPTASIKWNTTEKNYIDFKISRKQTMANGGEVEEKSRIKNISDIKIGQNVYLVDKYDTTLQEYKVVGGDFNGFVKFAWPISGNIAKDVPLPNVTVKYSDNENKDTNWELKTLLNENIFFNNKNEAKKYLKDLAKLIYERSIERISEYADGGKLPNEKTINGYDVHYFKTGRWVYANIEIPSPNPLFDDDTQIKGVGKDEKEAFNDLKKEFEKYLDRKKMAKGGELEDDTFVMLFKGYGFVEKRGAYGTKTFYNKQHNAYIYYDPKYRSISGYVGGGEGNDEVIPYSVEGVLDFFIEHDISESDATPLAKGGLLVQVGDKIKTKNGIEGVVYESTGQIFKLMDSLGVKSNTMHFAKDFKKGDIKTFGRGGMDVGRWYRDKSGEEYKYIGEDLKGRTLFNDGQKVMYKPLEDFEDEPKEKKLFKFFRMGGALKEDFLEDVAEMHDDIKEITLKDGSKITHDELMEAHQFLEPDETQEYYASMQYGKGGTFDSKVESISKKLVGKPVPKQYRKEYGSRYDKQDADEAARRIVGNMRKLYGE